MAFSKLGLNDRLVQGILATGYTAPTEIQERAIPLALEGRDVIGAAQTGTGKTAAFVLPILNRLSTNGDAVKERRPRALVLTPTRELAQQIEDALKQYGQFLKLRSLSIYGGVDIDKQVKRLRSGVDIVIATPGRLIDHMDRKTIELSAVEVLVLDEADRMFDMGFINDVKKIMSRVPAERQTLLFSATISKEIRALAQTVQRNPETIQIGEESKPVESVTQYFYSAPKEMKMDMLLFALEHETMDSVLVFSRTKHGADKITKRLARAEVKAIAIHSNRTQAQRQRALAGFKQGHFRVLVATDIAARGIDVDGISHVINYDVPSFAEEYVHRIGRTGRAAAIGDAITFVSKDEMQQVRKIEHFIGRKVEIKKYPTFNYTPAAHKPETAAPAPGHRTVSNTAPDDQRQQQPVSRKHDHHDHKERLQTSVQTVATHHHQASEQPAPVRSIDRNLQLAHSAERKPEHRKVSNVAPDDRQKQQHQAPGKFRHTPERRGPKVPGSAVPQRDRHQASGAHDNRSKGPRQGNGSQSDKRMNAKQHNGGKPRLNQGTRREVLPPVKKRVKPTIFKTESYSTGMYNDSFGTFRHSAAQEAPDHDWKKLIESNEGSFRKKLKKIFLRSND